jgi:hypothetical protein
MIRHSASSRLTDNCRVLDRATPRLQVNKCGPARRVAFYQRYAHAGAIGADGYRLLEALRRDPAARLWQIPVVEVLRRVWLAQFYVDGDRVRWRTAADRAPAGQRINSPYVAEATFGRHH